MREKAVITMGKQERKHDDTKQFVLAVTHIIIVIQTLNSSNVLMFLYEGCGGGKRDGSVKELYLYLPL